MEVEHQSFTSIFIVLMMNEIDLRKPSLFYLKYNQYRAAATAISTMVTTLLIIHEATFLTTTKPMMMMSSNAT